MYALTNVIGVAFALGKILRIDCLGTFQSTIQRLLAPEEEVKGNIFLKWTEWIFTLETNENYLIRVDYKRKSKYV